jgi:hypothetical protein
MVNAMGVLPLTKIRCRPIDARDVDAVVELLARGFPSRTREFWVRVLERLAEHSAPAGLPQYGYLLENAGVPVGVILLIFSTMATGAARTIRGNVSSWYVDPAFRSYAALLVAQALKHKDVTYLNVTPTKQTRPILEAQGYSRYSSGIFVAVPALQLLSGRAEVELAEASARLDVPFEAFERDLLLQHAGYGCTSFWAVTRECAHPFVFRPFVVNGVRVGAQLVYCRDVADFVRFAGPIGRFLAARWLPLVVIDANGPIAGLAGRFFAGRKPKYFKGPDRPRYGDLAYTEIAMFGV